MRPSLRLLSVGASAAVLVSCHGVRPEPAVIPSELRFVSRAEWGAKEPVLPMRRHTPVRLTIHHTATVQNPSRSVAEKLEGLQRFSQRDDSLSSGKKKPAWPDVPYHFYVGVDGVVGEGRDWHYVGDSNTPYDPSGHLLVVVEGSFERDTLTTAQRHTLDVLIPALARRFAIASDSLRAHRDYAETTCPGKHVYELLPELRTRIATGAR